MALSRTISHSLPRVQASLPLFALRRSSTKTIPAVVEVDLDSAESTEAIAVGIKKLEDAIQTLIVRRAAPDWLPFMPGCSYWVPPLQRSQPTLAARAEAAGIVEAVRKLAASNSASASSSSLRISSSRGWPSSEFFDQDISPLQTIPIVVVEDLNHVEDSEDDSHDEEDDE